MRAPEPTTRAPLKDELAAIVREAGALAARTFRGELKSWTKHGGSPVTEADIAVDSLLRERLTRLVPDCGWLSEESEDDRARLGGRGCGSSIRSTARAPMSRAAPTGRFRSRWWRTAARWSAAMFAPMEDGALPRGRRRRRDAQWRCRSRQAGRRFRRARASPGPKPMIERVREIRSPASSPSRKCIRSRCAWRASPRARLDIAFASENSHDWDLAAADLSVHEAGGALTTSRRRAARLQQRRGTARRAGRGRACAPRAR